jgi:hypothetical protein
MYLPTYIRKYAYVSTFASTYKYILIVLTYLSKYQLGREQHRVLKYGLGKKKNNINI